MGVTSRAAMLDDRRRRETRRRPPRRRRRYRLTIVLGSLLVAGLIARPLIVRVIQQLTLPLQYASIIRTQAHAKRLDPALVAAVIYAESRFRPRTSSTGAEGLMQIEPATARFLAHKSGGVYFSTSDLASPSVNIAYGSYYLRYLLNEYHGNKVLALAAYNGGDTNVNRWVASVNATGKRFAISDIPVSQTRAYVSEVLGAQRQYRSHYASELGYG